jgi:hypothetical protein
MIFGSVNQSRPTFAMIGATSAMASAGNAPGRRWMAMCFVHVTIAKTTSESQGCEQQDVMSTLPGNGGFGRWPNGQLATAPPFNDDNDDKSIDDRPQKEGSN